MKEPSSDTLTGVLDEFIASQPDHTAVIDQKGRSITYGELGERASVIAGGLSNYGIGAGDRVAILMENRVEWIETMFGALRLGATVVGISTWAKQRELRYYLSHSSADAVVSTATFAGTDFTTELQSMLGYESAPAGELDNDEFPNLDTVVFVDDERPGAVSFAELEDAEPLDTDDDPNKSSDAALLLYTSGSTSKPKGVPLLHGGIVENSYHIGERMHLTADDRIWLASPLFWSYGSANALGAMLTHGGSIVLQAPFDPETALDLIATYRCTVYYGMINMARQMVNADGFAREELSLRTGTTIGPPKDIAFTMDELGISEICNVYGSTETYGNCAVTDCKAPREIRLETQGEPLPGQDIVIKDTETGDRLEQGEVGEIRVGGRITPGYHENPTQNDEAFDDEGYLKMGDLGRLTEDGRVQYRGRLKNVIKTGGINVSAKEVEELLLEHPGVEQAYVVGLPDEEKDEIVGATIVPGDDQISVDSLRQHCKALSAYKRPVRYSIVGPDDVPETDTGKVKKAALDALFD